MKRVGVIVVLALMALLLCSTAGFAQEEAPVVYFTSDISPNGLLTVYEALGWEPGEKVAVKLSTGESDKTNYLRPELIKDLVQALNATIVECNTAYAGSRAATAEHYQVAEDRGYTEIADFQIMDEYGSMEIPVENGDRLDGDLVGAHFADYDSYVILSHFKGHAMAGYGGAIKNISIGLASSMGKVRIHSGGTSDTHWHDELHTEFLEAMAEAGKAVSDYLGDRIIYINVMNRLSIDCDCDPNPSEPDIHDIGILASYDPVALDQACLDLIYKAEGNERFLHRLHELDGEHTLEHAVEMGLGVREYTLMNVTDGIDNVYTPFKATEEKLAELITLPEEENAAIEAMEPYSAEDTWAFYVYLIGSDLESLNMDNLADITSMMTADKAAEIRKAKREQNTADLVKFVTELQAQGMELPAVFYQPTANYSYSGGGINPDDPEEEGYAMINLRQMLSVQLPSNIRIIIQTGGAKRWQAPYINPNRTQRFVIDETGLHEVYSVPAIQMSDPDNLADFLKWSIENYPADHTVVDFWDHGGAFTGFGHDEIFGEMLSIRDLHDALEEAVGSHPEAPYFEAIGFDACLMANAEVAHELYGYARYLYASEETEPGTGWNYDLFLQKLVDHPGMNGAQLGKAITDTYLEPGVKDAADIGYIGAGTFAVIDLNEAESVYQAYGAFAKEALKAVIENPQYLSSLTEAANRSVFYAGSYYKIYNTIDLGLFMDNVPEVFKDEAANVKEQLKKAILYHRGTGYLSQSQGLSIYYPAHIEDYSGLSTALSYINHISGNRDINALYYYKIAGCLNEEMQDYTESEGFGKPQALDFSILRGISDVKVTADNSGNFSFSLSDEQLALVQDARLQLAYYDEETGYVTYFGEDRYITMSDENTIVAAFDGTWLTMNGAILPTEIIGDTDEYITYTVPMVYNKSTNVDFMLSYHFDTQTVDFLGIRPSDNTADLIGRDLLPMKPGSIFNTVYEYSSLNSYGTGKSEGEMITIDENLDFSYQPLPDGKYLAYVVVEDLRSDKYYTPVFQYTLEDGKIIDTAVMDNLFAYDDAK